MATLAPDNLLWLAAEWENAIPSAVLSGIVGDPAHQQTASKHNSRQDNPPNSWPVAHSKDRQGPSNRACAIDMSMSSADMKLVHNRFKAVYNNKADSRRQYLYAFNGWDGNGSPGRYNLVNDTISTTDDSHKWHEHVELFYLYVGDDAESKRAAHAILSIVTGMSDAEWKAEGEDMEASDFLAILKDPAVAAEMSRLPWAFKPSGGQKTAHAIVLNDHTAKLDGIEQQIAALGSAQLTITDAQLTELANHVAQVLVTKPDNPLGEADKPAIVEAVKQALREGTTDQL